MRTETWKQGSFKSEESLESNPEYQPFCAFATDSPSRCSRSVSVAATLIHLRGLCLWVLIVLATLLMCLAAGSLGA